MKLILYVGHHKVGSTALQVFLSQNWLALARAGILYPAVESEGFSDHLKRALDGADTPGKPPINVREPHNALAFRLISQSTGNAMPPYHRNLPSTTQMLRAIRNQVGQLAPHTVILCGEVMSNFGKTDPTLIGQLLGALPQAEIELYCTLRRPDEYLASWYGQRLKFGHRIEALRDGGAMGYARSIHFDYRTMLEPWITRLPGTRLHLRTYAEVLAAGGSVEDFTTEIDAGIPADLTPAVRANESLPYALMEIMRRGNQRLDRPGSRKLRKFLLAAADRLDLPPNREVELFGADTRVRLVRAFDPIHAWLGEIVGRDAFFPDIAAMRQARPIPELDAAAVAARALRDTPEELRPDAAVWEVVQAITDAPLE